MGHRTEAELLAYVDHLRAAPATIGQLDLVVRRPDTGTREILTVGCLDVAGGLVGDDPSRRLGARRRPLSQRKSRLDTA
ncbi:MAG: hypothetical protein ACRCYU_11385 [Nocardioides sp.]